MDEAYSLGVASKPFHDILAFLRTSDAHPIGYYALLSAWIRVFGTGLAAARFPSLLCGVAAVFLTWRIGRDFFSPAVGIAAAALVALNPFQIIASNEMRMYLLLECVALASTWILWRASRSTSLVWWVGYGVSLALMAYTSYYSFVLIPAQLLWVFLSRSSRHPIVDLYVAGLVALLLYLPWIPYALALPDRGIPWRQPVHLNYLFGVAATQIFGGYLFNTGSYYTIGSGLPLTDNLLVLLPFLALLGAGVVALGRVNARARLLVGLSWAGPLVLIVLVSVARGGIAAYPRHLVFLEPFAALLVAAGIVHLRTFLAAAPRAVVPPLAFLLIVAFGYPAVAQANPAYQYYRYDLAAEYVRTHYTPGDAIVYFPGGTDLPFRYYFSPPGAQIVILTDRRHWSRTALQSPIRQAADSVAAHGVERVWLVYSLPWPRGSLSDLVQALNERTYRESPSQDFRDLWVMLLVRSDSRAPHP
jgi:uncharacterized membrane protein